MFSRFSCSATLLLCSTNLSSPMALHYTLFGDISMAGTPLSIRFCLFNFCLSSYVDWPSLFLTFPCSAIHVFDPNPCLILWLTFPTCSMQNASPEPRFPPRYVWRILPHNWRFWQRFVNAQLTVFLLFFLLPLLHTPFICFLPAFHQFLSKYAQGKGSRWHFDRLFFSFLMIWRRVSSFLLFKSWCHSLTAFRSFLLPN